MQISWAQNGTLPVSLIAKNSNHSRAQNEILPFSLQSETKAKGYIARPKEKVT
jgi:hypothetical protein